MAAARRRAGFPGSMARTEGIRAMARDGFKRRQPFLWTRPEDEDEEPREGDDEREEDEEDRETEEREDEREEALGSEERDGEEERGEENDRGDGAREPE